MYSRSVLSAIRLMHPSGICLFLTIQSVNIFFSLRQTNLYCNALGYDMQQTLVTGKLCIFTTQLLLLLLVYPFCCVDRVGNGGKTSWVSYVVLVRCVFCRYHLGNDVLLLLFCVRYLGCGENMGRSDGVAGFTMCFSNIPLNMY